MHLESRMVNLLMEGNQTENNGFLALEGQKSIILVAMLIVTFSFGVLPIRVLLLNLPNDNIPENQEDEHLAGQERLRNKSRSKRWKTIIGFANCFSGGVFVAACLLDLFPDVREAVDNVLEEIENQYDTQIEYPMAEFIIVFGFFLVLIIEQVVLDFKERWLNNEQKKPIPSIHSEHNVHTVSRNSHNEIDETSSLIANPSEPVPTAADQQQLFVSNSVYQRNYIEKSSSRKHYGSTTVTPSTSTSHNQIQGGEQESILQSGESSSNDNTDNSYVKFARKSKNLQSNKSVKERLRQDSEESLNQIEQISPALTRQEESTEEHDDHSRDGVFLDDLSTLRSFLLLTALTFHSIFEGLAIGLQQESLSLFQIFIAVIVHKAVMAFSLGLNLAQSAGMTVRKFLLANLIFSVASPLGMGLGILLSHLQKSLARDVANGILQGIAGGTFLYITFFEVLPNEFTAKTKYRLFKVICVIAGYSIICTLLFLTHA